MKRQSVRARVKARRESARKLGEREARLRCKRCKVELGAVKFQVWGEPGSYCSVACRDEKDS